MNQNFLVHGPNGEIIGNCLITPGEGAMIATCEGIGLDDTYRKVFSQTRPQTRLDAILRVLAVGLNAGMAISTIGKLIADLNKSVICGMMHSQYGVDSIMDLSGDETHRAIDDIVNSGVIWRIKPGTYLKYPPLISGKMPQNHSKYSPRILSTLVAYIKYEIEQGRTYQQIGDSLQQLETRPVRCVMCCESIFEITDAQYVESHMESLSGTRYKGYVKRYSDFLKGSRLRQGNLYSISQNIPGSRVSGNSVVVPKAGIAITIEDGNIVVSGDGKTISKQNIPEGSNVGVYAAGMCSVIMLMRTGRFTFEQIKEFGPEKTRQIVKEIFG